MRTIGAKEEVRYIINFVLLQARGQQAYCGKFAPGPLIFLEFHYQKKSKKLEFTFSISNA